MPCHLTTSSAVGPNELSQCCHVPNVESGHRHGPDDQGPENVERDIVEDEQYQERPGIDSAGLQLYV